MKIHFIGIGGIGTSALAQYYLEKGDEVSGSDLVDSEITLALKKKGGKVFVGKHTAKNVSKNVDLVIYSPAVEKTNPELKRARDCKIKILSYPQALGELTKKYFTIAVAGTHGKSTTTAMIGLLLKKVGLDPTVIVGTKVREFNNSNCRVGKSRYLVIEADEHFASFLNYWPKIIVLTTIEKDHLDFYKSLENILKSFKEFISHLPKSGTLVWNKDDKNIPQIISSKPNFKTKAFTLGQKESKALKKILKIPGDHNVSNALAALTVARILRVKDKKSFKALSEYKGAWRRFETHQTIYRKKRFTVVSDYAHHPTEVRATIKAARQKFPRSKIWVVFQPHQYQRTFFLFNDFVKSFDEADEVIITNIYTVAGREKKEICKKVNAKMLTRAIQKRGKNAHFIGKMQNIVKFLKLNVNNKDVVLIMGAGDIYKLCKSIIHTRPCTKNSKSGIIH